MSQGLHMQRYFTNEKIHPFDVVAWDVGDVVIQGKDGPVFEACEVEFPDFWSQRARDIVASKYFRVVDVDGPRETSVKEMLERVVYTIASWGYNDCYFDAHNARNPRSGLLYSPHADTFRAELMDILLHQYASFNSPVWFNVGIQEKPQTSACFTVDVQDSMESILDWYRQEGMIFKGGSGCGVNLSPLRSVNSPLSSGGVASGVMSFMKVADANAGAIKSGGSTRRAAAMRILNIDHPEIEAFIRCKVDAEKLAHVLMQNGYGNGIEGGAYDNVPWQNANNSVSVHNLFMRYATRPDPTVELTSAQDMLRTIAEAAWECGDPGLFFLDTVNEWNTTPHRGSIISSNPCGEFLQPPNSACNLASINLLKFLKDDNTFDTDAFCHTVDIMVTAMDILIDRSSYPTEAIAQHSRDYRPIGLGYSNLGALLMAKGLPYDSEEGRHLAGAITSLMTGQAYRQSAELAEVRGAFTGYTQNCEAMREVLYRHYISAVTAFDREDASTEVKRIGFESLSRWESVGNAGRKEGFRNCQVTCLAPCGTISFMMDCDTTGIEPCLGLVTTKKLVGGGEVKMVNGVVDRAMRSLGYSNDARRAWSEAMCDDRPFFYGETDLRMREGGRQVFATALGDNPISWQGHIKMVAEVQPFISMGISKTINMPHESTVQDVFDAYVMAWKSGLKAIAIYRDGSKGVQPVTVARSVETQNQCDAMVNAAVRARQQHEARLEDLIGMAEGVQPVVGTNNEESLDRHPPLERTEYTFPPFDSPSLHFDSPSLHRMRLPDERKSITHKFTVNAHEGYLTVGCYDNGSPGELFVRMSKEGSTLGGLMDAWATMVSIALQYGVPLDVITQKFRDTQFEPRGFTGNPEIRMVSSILDYIARWLEQKFPVTTEKKEETRPEQEEKARAILAQTTENTPAYLQSTTAWSLPQEKKKDVLRATQEERKTLCMAAIFGKRNEGRYLGHNFWLEEHVHGNSTGDLPLCSACGGMMQRAGSCQVCTVCGTTTGCA